VVNDQETSSRGLGDCILFSATRVIRRSPQEGEQSANGIVLRSAMILDQCECDTDHLQPIDSPPTFHRTARIQCLPGTRGWELDALVRRIVIETWKETRLELVNLLNLIQP
jgi:hypothetical protein